MTPSLAFGSYPSLLVLVNLGCPLLVLLVCRPLLQQEQRGCFCRAPAQWAAAVAAAGVAVWR
jgi:hypothetical protein